VNGDGFKADQECGAGGTGAAEGDHRIHATRIGPEFKELRGDSAFGTGQDAAAALGLIDEYRARVYPVLVGGGIPFFPRRERRVDLELVETRTFSSRVVYLRYRVAR
jgi:dihydrofolate reductase